MTDTFRTGSARARDSAVAKVLEDYLEAEFTLTHHTKVTIVAEDKTVSGTQFYKVPNPN